MRPFLLALALGACDSPVDSGDPRAPEPVADLDGVAVTFVGEATEFQAGASVGDTLVWDFGDGATAEGASVSHVYTEPGRYAVRLTASTADGQRAVGSATRVAVNRPLEEAPVSSGRLALAGGRLYAALPDEDAVAVVAGDAWIDLWPTCGHPTALSASATHLAVACRDDAVQVFDLATHELVVDAALRWGARPEGVVVDGAAALVALAGTGELARVDASGVTPVAALADPRALARAEGVVWAPRFRSVGGAGALQRVADGVTTVALAPDLGPDSDTDARGVPNLLGAVAVRPDGGAVVVAGLKDNLERGLRRDGLALTPETGSRAALRVLGADGEALGRALFDNRDLVGAVAFTPLGDTLVVAHLGSGMVDLLDPFSLTRLGGYQNVGVGLDGVATDGESVWVLASSDAELVAFDLAAGSAVERARVSLTRIGVDLGAQVFHGAGDRRMSQDGYVSCASCHLDGGGDGQVWDFSDRGEGYRDTQALFAIPDAGPFHWSANFDEVQDFENAIRAHQGGTGFLADELLSEPLDAPKAGLSPELDALAAYVRAFEPPRSPWRNPDGTITEAARRGREVFLAEGCADCHAGREGSDAGWNDDGSPILHDVGTLLETSGGRAGGELAGLRTPTLLGLHATAPYLHDGRAATLEDAMLAHGESADPDLLRYLLEIEGVVE